MASPLMTLLFAPANMQRSASPSKVRPICAPRVLTSAATDCGWSAPQFGVDVAAVGGDVEEGDAAGAEAAEELGSDGGGGSVGAVGDDVEAGEREAGDGSMRNWM